MADNVFEHDDGIVHHKTDSQGQGHKGEVVHAVAAKRHDGKGRNDRHRQGEGGNDGGPEIVQKKKNHQHDQKNGQDQGELDLAYGFPDGFRTVIKDLHLHARRQLAQKTGQYFAYCVYHLNGIGARLPVNGKRYARHAAVAPVGLLVLLDGILDNGNFAQTHGRAVFPGYYRIFKVPGIVKLAGRLDGQSPLLARKLTGGQHGIDAHYGIGNFVYAKPPAGQGVRVELDAYFFWP